MDARRVDRVAQDLAKAYVRALLAAADEHTVLDVLRGEPHRRPTTTELDSQLVVSGSGGASHTVVRHFAHEDGHRQARHSSRPRLSGHVRIDDRLGASTYGFVSAQSTFGAGSASSTGGPFGSATIA